jgi:hypothetical protein
LKKVDNIQTTYNKSINPSYKAYIDIKKNASFETLKYMVKIFDKYHQVLLPSEISSELEKKSIRISQLENKLKNTTEPTKHSPCSNILDPLRIKLLKRKIKSEKLLEGQLTKVNDFTKDFICYENNKKIQIEKSLSGKSNRDYLK